MIFEIINPSDAATMAADDPKVAQAACILFGGGMYGLSDERGENVLSVMAFASPDQADEYLRELFGGGADPLMAFVAANREAVAAALDSVMLGKPSTRWLYEEALRRIPEGERQGFREVVADRLRSSLNDFTARAWALAKRLRTVPVEP